MAQLQYLKESLVKHYYLTLTKHWLINAQGQLNCWLYYVAHGIVKLYSIVGIYQMVTML
ncbi:hypothetical protein D9M68_989640 [compost metagenome]